MATLIIAGSMIALMAAGVSESPVLGLVGAFSFCMGFVVFIGGRLME